jgi:hypothetical protein
MSNTLVKRWASLAGLADVPARWPIIVFSLLLACVDAHAQGVQFLPEVDTYVKLNSIVRVYGQAKDDRDGGDPTQATIGPSIQLYSPPILKLKRITAFDLDDATSRALVFEAGYRVITSPNDPTENQFLVAVTSHLPLRKGFLVSDRNRAEMDWKAGTFYWRYRNKLTIERNLAIHSFKLIPYVAAEPYYESQYKKWSTTALYAGSLVPIGRHVQLNPYYEHQNNTGKHENTQTNSIGLALYLFFSLEKKPPQKQ